MTAEKKRPRLSESEITVAKIKALLRRWPGRVYASGTAWWRSDPFDKIDNANMDRGSIWVHQAGGMGAWFVPDSIEVR
jgi:hypothetical protein